LNFSAITSSDTPLARINSIRVRSAWRQIWQRAERCMGCLFGLMICLDDGAGDAVSSA
jgi:hypothetical protein